MCTVRLLSCYVIVLKSYGPWKYSVIYFCLGYISFTNGLTTSIFIVYIPYISQMCTVPLISSYTVIWLQSYAPFQNCISVLYVWYYFTNSFDSYMVCLLHHTHVHCCINFALRRHCVKELWPLQISGNVFLPGLYLIY